MSSWPQHYHRQSFSRFLANNGNSRLSLDGYFVHQQNFIQYLQRWRGPSVNLRTIQTLKSLSLRIAPAHNRVGEGACLLQRKPIDWLWNACRRNATEQRKPLKSVLHGCRAMTIIILVILYIHTYIHTGGMYDNYTGKLSIVDTMEPTRRPTTVIIYYYKHYHY